MEHAHPAHRATPPSGRIRILLTARRCLIGAIRAYRYLISPLLPAHCRFYPTCSHYAEQAIARHGVGRGLWLAVRRLLKCHPAHPGGIDPVPLRTDRQARPPRKTG